VKIFLQHVLPDTAHTVAQKWASEPVVGTWPVSPSRLFVVIDLQLRISFVVQLDYPPLNISFSTCPVTNPGLRR